MTMREKQITWKGLLESKKKIGGNHAFLEISKQQLFEIAVKYKAMYGVFLFFFFFFQIDALLSPKNAWLPPIFFLDSKSTC